MIINDEELFFIDYEIEPSKVIVYAPRRSYLALADKRLESIIKAEEYSATKNMFFNKLKNRSYIDLEKFLETAHNSRPILSIAITEDCSLRCVYCYASAGELHKKKSLSIEMIDSILLKYLVLPRIT